MPEPDSHVPDLLRAMRGDRAEPAEAMRSTTIEITATGRHRAGGLTVQRHDHEDVAAIKDRLDRIERRLEPAD